MKISQELNKIAKIIEADKKEYVIWGISPKHGNEEQLLLEKPEGKVITDRAMAEKLAKILEEKYGCKKVRIQELDMEGEFDWLDATGLKKTTPYKINRK